MNGVAKPGNRPEGDSPIGDQIGKLYTSFSAVKEKWGALLSFIWRTFMFLRLPFLLLLSSFVLEGGEKEHIRNYIPTYSSPLSEELPTSKVNGCVDAISGQYFEYEVDLFVPGPEPLTVERSYTSSPPKEWRNNISEPLTLDFHDYDKRKGGYKTVSAKYWELRGDIIECYGSTTKRKEEWHLKVDFQRTQGLTNCNRGELSGRTHLKNIEITHKNDTHAQEAIVVDGTSEKRIFEEHYPNFFLLAHLKKPNGNIIEYAHNEDNSLKSIVSKSKQGTFFASLDYCHHNPELIITSHDGRNVKYRYVSHQGSNNQTILSLKSVEKADGSSQSYEYERFPHRGQAKVCLKNNEEGRFIAIKYLEENKKDPQLSYRVESIASPVGRDNKPIETHRFSYNLNKDGSGSTVVTDLANTKTTYEFSDEKRLTAIHKANPSGLFSTKRFFWHNQGRHIGNLLSITYIGKNGKFIYAHGYEYDDAGNVLKETLKGNLTGKNAETPAVDANGNLIENQCDSYTLKKTYNNKNQILTESEENGVEISYSYYPENDLLFAKYLWENGLIKMREYYFYDSNNTLIRFIVDDGSTQNPQDLTGVSERHITDIVPKNSTPCLGYPEIVMNKYLDLKACEEKLLKKTIKSYSREGYLVKEEIYDENDIFQHALVKEYDSMGNTVLETDSLGQTIQRKFDRNANCVFEQGPKARYCKRYTYDFMNRLVKVEETIDNQTLVTSHDYNYLNQKILTVDPSGQITRFSYDSFGNLSEITLPQALNENGILMTSQENFLYNELGQCTHHYNDQQLTQIEMTINGNIYYKKYPDGTFENNIYSTNGLLLQTTSRNQTTVKYTYDYLKRCIKEEVYSKEGNILSKCIHRYNAFHLLETIDTEGRSITHQYDYAGRKITPSKCDVL